MRLQVPYASICTPDATGDRRSPLSNEEGTLRRNLPAALAHADEVVVSDGGSADGTLAVARELGARIVSGPAGRGGQLNRGRRMAHGRRRPPLPPRRHGAAARTPAARQRGRGRGRARRRRSSSASTCDRSVYRLGERLDQPAHAAGRHAAGRPGAVRHPRSLPRARAASATGRSWKTSTSRCGCAALGPHACSRCSKIRSPPSARRFEEQGPARTVATQLADLAAVRAGCLAAPAGEAVPPGPVEVVL